MVALLGAVPALAPAQIRAAPPRQEEVKDPLGRGTPRGAITGFTSAVHHEDYLTAAEYLQLTDAQRGQAGQLSRSLQALMDRYFLEPVVSLSDEPGGATNDGLPLDRERVRLTISDKPIDIFLVRVGDPQVGQIWLISSASLAQVPLLTAMLEKTWVEEEMPQPLVRHAFMGISLAEWLVWAVSITMPLVLLLTLSSVGIRRVRRRIDSPSGRAMLDAWHAGLRWPSIILLTLLGHAALMPFLGFPLRFRLGYARVLLVIAVLTSTWLVIRLCTLAFAYARLVITRRGQAGTSSFMLFGERVFKLVVLMVAVFTLLSLAGVNTTAALAGVGIGGIAVAFGAQKSVENLLGGVFLLADKAIAVGDYCRISNRLGWVEDITLRSVRLRTMERTLLSIPAGALSQDNVENYATRDKILIQTILRLRYGTTTEQLQTILGRVRALLADHPQLERDTARIGLVDFGKWAVELELFAYVLTPDFATFMSVRESLLLQVAAMVESAGTDFARPVEAVYDAEQRGNGGLPQAAATRGRSV
jgi:MscS family membrane protein